MKRTILFAATIFAATSVSGQTLKVDTFTLDSLQLEGSYCQFGAQQAALLASDWDKKFWMKIDGKMLVFQSQKREAEVESQAKNKHWRETLNADGLTVRLDLIETGRGDDSAIFRGRVEVQRGSTTRRFAIAGGCGA